MKYLLIQWPESQYFIGMKDCYFISLDKDAHLGLDQAMFVPEDLYNEFVKEQSKRVFELENTEYDFGHNVKHFVD
jgi:hypothetical protein